jgi:pyruvate formate lyase activating enzyme
MTPSAPAPTLEVGGFEPFSTSDWPGQLVAVVFVQGCPWRCSYCHNPGLQPRGGAHAGDWAAALDLLRRRVGLLDGVVFSGGEPLLDPALPQAIDAVRALGFQVGLHTAGIYPQRLAALLPRLDWVGLDLKSAPEGYEAVTGVARSERPALQTLALLASGSVPFEVRSTGDDELLPAPVLQQMAALLVRQGVHRWVLQRRRDAQGHAIGGASWPDDDTRAAIQGTGIELLLR